MWENFFPNMSTLKKMENRLRYPLMRSDTRRLILALFVFNPFNARQQSSVYRCRNTDFFSPPDDGAVDHIDLRFSPLFHIFEHGRFVSRRQSLHRLGPGLGRTSERQFDAGGNGDPDALFNGFESGRSTGHPVFSLTPSTFHPIL